MREVNTDKLTDEHLKKLTRLTMGEVRQRKEFPFQKPGGTCSVIQFDTKTRTMIAKVVNDIAKELLEV